MINGINLNDLLGSKESHVTAKYSTKILLISMFKLESGRQTKSAKEQIKAIQQAVMLRCVSNDEVQKIKTELEQRRRVKFW